MIEIRKERDASKMEKNELIIRHAKEIEEERTQRRLMTTENDKLKFRAKCLEDDIHKEQLKAERKSQEALAENKEKTSHLATLKERELMIDSMRRQLNQAKEDLHQKELELEAQMRRGQVEDKERGMIERKEKTRLQREMDTLQRNFTDLDQQRRREIESLKEELKACQTEAKKTAEQRDGLLHNQREATRNFDEVNKRLANKQSEFDSLQKDFSMMQQQMRSLMSSEGNLMTEKEKLEAQKKMSGEEAKQMHDHMEKQAETWASEKRDL